MHSTPDRIPGRTALESDMPVEFMRELALREGNRKKPIYETHKWWARRLGTCFRMLLLGAVADCRTRNCSLQDRFYLDHDFGELTVLDPFMGGGTSLVESAKLGAKVVGCDIDPVACLVTEKELAQVDQAALRKAYEAIEETCADRIKARYVTQLEDEQTAEIVYAFWVDVVCCSECGTEAQGHPHYRLAVDSRNKVQTVFCRACGAIKEVSTSWDSFCCDECGERTHVESGVTRLGVFHCPACQAKTRVVDMVSNGHPLTRQLFALEAYEPNKKTKAFKRAGEADLALFNEAAAELTRNESSLLLPDQAIPTEGRQDMRPVNHGFATYRSLFNERQLLCLGELASAVSGVSDPHLRGFLALALSDSLASNNMLCAYAFGYRKLTPLFGLHSYRKILRPVENNVWGTRYGRGSFSKCFEKLVRAKTYSRSPYEVSYSNGHHARVQSKRSAEAKMVSSFGELLGAGEPAALILNDTSENLAPVPNDSVDIVLTDPPYYDNLHYSELSDFYHVWLAGILGSEYYGQGTRHTPLKASLFPTTDAKTSAESAAEDFRRSLVSIFGECGRVLKPDGIMVLTHHHRELLAWQNVAAALLLNGFAVTNILPVRAEGRGGFHNSDGNLRWDSVVVSRKTANETECRIRPATVKRRVARWAREWHERFKKSSIEVSLHDMLSIARSRMLVELSGHKWEESALLGHMAECDPVLEIGDLYRDT